MAGEIFGSRILRVGDTGDDVQEMKIRLSGFKNASVPNTEFDNQFKSTVMSFQRDYMKIQPSGECDLQTYDASDRLATEFPFGSAWTTQGKLKCPCNDSACQVTNSGFGHNDNDGVYRTNKPETEAYHAKEYLGIHRMLLWAVRAVYFYNPQYTWTINSGYRCRVDNTLRGRQSTNHMGKAIDIDPGGATECDDARRRIIQKSNGQVAWNSTNKKALEPSNIAPTWVHFDVRTFDQAYLTSDFFVTNEIDLDNVVTHTLTENSEEVAEEPLYDAQKEVSIVQDKRQHNVSTSESKSSDQVVTEVEEAGYDDIAEGIYNYVTNVNGDSYELKAITVGIQVNAPPPPTPLTDVVDAFVYFGTQQSLRDLLKNTTMTGSPDGGIENFFKALNTWLNTPTTIGLAAQSSSALLTSLTPTDNGSSGLHGIVSFPTVINQGIACEKEMKKTDFPENPKETKVKSWEIMNKYIKMALNLNVIAPMPTVGVPKLPSSVSYSGMTTVTLVYS